MANRNQFRRLGLADEVAAPALAPALARLRHPKTLRRVLLTAGPVLVLAGGGFVFPAGRRPTSPGHPPFPPRQPTHAPHPPRGLGQHAPARKPPGGQGGGPFSPPQ